MKSFVMPEGEDAAFDPYWQFDPAQHFQPHVHKGDFYRLAGHALLRVLISPLYEMKSGSSNELAWTLRLSYGQKAIYYWWLLDGRVTNGGFDSFYFHDYGRYIPTIIKGLVYT